jgi:DNA-binding NarL/FixJ family response regulator
MDALISKLEGNKSSSHEGTHILMIGNCQTMKLVQSLESEKDLLIISVARTVDEVIAIAGFEKPDVIIVQTDNVTPFEIFNNTLKTLCRIEMNTRTVILSDNPFRYLSGALKAGVAALLCRKMDNRDLLLIIHEVRSWSHGQPIPNEIISPVNLSGHETKSGGE